MPKKVKLYCEKCGEPTTHRANPGGSPEWVCICCETSKAAGRTSSDIAKIRKKRKSQRSFIPSR